ncbi:exopolysaccharide biosynthesis protein [Vreelandella andesensis]|uniref:Exopolysaccharide biosynthesis protein n=1 Tax=Vreelandella andesensis TaxID=447567 RepID=A0A433KW18_9GAMM|nr:exopolysaccharide biosynthesis protein [Halomonas andesensis]RUR33856.1 exopolysaccharide biosynthesis protein [Halomonas andesensis]
MSLVALLRALPGHLKNQRPTLGDILAALDERATPLVLLLFAIPAIVPTPGIPAGMVFGSALAFIGIQMAIGTKRIRLPPGIAHLRIGRQQLERILGKATPHLEKLERHLSVRLGCLITPLAIRSIGVVIFIMALLIALPIPFGNTLPGLAVLILSLGIAQRDGIAVAAGLGLAVIAAVISTAIIGGSWRLIEIFFKETLLISA